VKFKLFNLKILYKIENFVARQILHAWNLQFPTQVTAVVNEIDMPWNLRKGMDHI